MKKLTILVLATMFSFTVASAEIGLRIGVSGAVGVYETSGSEKDVGLDETDTNKATDSNELLVGLGSIFIEKTLEFLPGPLGRLSVGYDYVPYDINTGSQSRTDTDLDGDLAVIEAEGSNADIIVRSASATVSDINTLYLTLNVTDWLYVKGGMTEMDVKSGDSNSLDGTSGYGSISLDGTTYGVGVMGQNEAGFGFKLAYEYTDIDGGTLNHKTNANNSITIDSVEGYVGKVSVYKAF